VTLGQRWMESAAVVRIYEGAFRPLVTRLVGGPTYAQEEAWLTRWSRVAHAGPVLDVACGTGRYTRWLADRHGRTTLGLDLSPPMLDAAERAGLTVLGASAQALPLRDRSVAGLNCFGALHLFPDPLAALAEFGRVLVPGGGLTVFCGLRQEGRLQRLLPVVDWVGEDTIREGLAQGAVTLDTWDSRGWMVMFAGTRAECP